MGRLSNKLRSIGGDSVAFWCTGCDEAHAVGAGSGPGPRWGYNGNPDAPTFTPSMLVRSGHYVPGGAGERGVCWCTYNAQHPEEPDPFRCICCHSFVTDGRVQFLDDCTHALAGRTVDLPDWPQRGGAA